MTCSFAVCQAWNLNHTCIGQSFILISLLYRGNVYSRQQNRSLEFLSAAERWSGWVIPGRKRSTTRQGEFARIRIGNDQRKHSKDHFVDWKWPFSGKGLLQEEAWQLGRCIPTIWSGLALWRYFSMIVRSIYISFVSRNPHPRFLWWLFRTDVNLPSSEVYLSIARCASCLNSRPETVSALPDLFGAYNFRCSNQVSMTLMIT